MNMNRSQKAKARSVEGRMVGALHVVRTNNPGQIAVGPQHVQSFGPAFNQATPNGGLALPGKPVIPAGGGVLHLAPLAAADPFGGVSTYLKAIISGAPFLLLAYDASQFDWSSSVPGATGAHWITPRNADGRDVVGLQAGGLAYAQGDSSNIDTEAANQISLTSAGQQYLVNKFNLAYYLNGDALMQQHQSDVIPGAPLTNWGPYDFTPNVGGKTYLVYCFKLSGNDFANLNVPDVSSQDKYYIGDGYSLAGREQLGAVRTTHLTNPGQLPRGPQGVPYFGPAFNQATPNGGLALPGKPVVPAGGGVLHLVPLGAAVPNANGAPGNAPYGFLRVFDVVDNRGYHERAFGFYIASDGPQARQQAFMAMQKLFPNLIGAGGNTSPANLRGAVVGDHIVFGGATNGQIVGLVNGGAQQVQLTYAGSFADPGAPPQGPASANAAVAALAAPRQHLGGRALPPPRGLLGARRGVRGMLGAVGDGTPMTCAQLQTAVAQMLAVLPETGVSSDIVTQATQLANTANSQCAAGDTTGANATFAQILPLLGIQVPALPAGTTAPSGTSSTAGNTAVVNTSGTPAPTPAPDNTTRNVAIGVGVAAVALIGGYLVFGRGSKK